MDSGNALVVFQGKNIRRIWHNNEWHFSIVDVVGVLTESSIPKRYWSDLKIKLKEEGFESYDKIVQLKFKSSDNKLYNTDCLSTEDLLRVIQSIPSPKAEPFKIWLAELGNERINETQDPELAIDRAMQNYLRKGYSKSWINQRLKSIEVRKELTDEWEERGVKKGKEYAILTDEITKAWAGKSVKDYKKFKSLRKENLRDNMSNLELVLNMLAEASTTEISKKEKPDTLDKNKDVAQKGGSVAGLARKELESKTGSTIVSSLNAKQQSDSKQLEQ